MSAKIKQLRDADNTQIYPVTKASAVYMPNGIDTVERVLTDSGDYDTTITFSTDRIEQTLASGGTKVISFTTSEIKEVTRDADNIIISTKTTTFNADGSIEIEVQ